MFSEMRPPRWPMWTMKTSPRRFIWVPRLWLGCLHRLKVNAVNAMKILATLTGLNHRLVIRDKYGLSWLCVLSVTHLDILVGKIVTVLQDISRSNPMELYITHLAHHQARTKSQIWCGMPVQLMLVRIAWFHCFFLKARATGCSWAPWKWRWSH